MPTRTKCKSAYVVAKHIRASAVQGLLGRPHQAQAAPVVDRNLLQPSAQAAGQADKVLCYFVLTKMVECPRLAASPAIYLAYGLRFQFPGRKKEET